MERECESARCCGSLSLAWRVSSAGLLREDSCGSLFSSSSLTVALFRGHFLLFSPCGQPHLMDQRVLAAFSLSPATGARRDHVIPILNPAIFSLPWPPSVFFSKGWWLGGSSEGLPLPSYKATTLMGLSGYPTFLSFSLSAHKRDNTLESPRKLYKKNDWWLPLPCLPKEILIGLEWDLAMGIYFYSSSTGFKMHPGLKNTGNILTVLHLQGIPRNLHSVGTACPWFSVPM